jgi:hypothetical protein
MQNKSQHRNVIPATNAGVAGTLNSNPQTATWGRGVRFFVTVAGGTPGGGTDAIFLCAIRPGGNVPVPIAGLSGVNLLSTNGTVVADFYPGAWLPPTGQAPAVTLGSYAGIAGIYLPMTWTVRVVMGAGDNALISVDAEIYP